MSSADSKPADKPLFPVYVPAHALTQPGSFAQQLAHAIALQLKGHNYIPLADGFFRGPPLPDARWLILIDGLDEISDIDERLRLLRTLRSYKNGPYQFVISSRPLPDSELAILDEDNGTGPVHEKTGRGGKRGLDEFAGRRDVDDLDAENRPAGRYELLPLDVNELPAFVRGWMEAARVPDLTPAVAAFMHQVNSGRLRELVRNPLMATILCQLHAADPTHPLPKGRYGAYQRFYELLCDRFYDPSPAGVNHQLQAQLRGYGAQSSAAISALPSGVLAALGQAAFGQQHEHASVAALEQIRTCVAPLRPDDMPVSRWDALTAQVLRCTGLVVVTAGDVVFVHQTLAEFLAARHAARDPRTGERELLRLSDKNGLRPLSYLTSYDRFLVAAWIAEDRCPAGLRELIVELSGSYSSAAGIAELIRDGVDLGDEVRELVAGTLRRMANGRGLSKTMIAAEDLASVDVPSAVEVLSIVLKNPTISFLARARLSKKIIEFDPLRAVDVFAELSMSRRLDIMYRDHASDYLTELDRARAASVIAEMVREREGNANELIVLIKKLARLDAPIAVSMLTDVLSRRTWKEPHRSRLLTWLSEMESSL
ncbi:NACHT domain-containing protein [Nonomuraea sp. NPDC004297]